MNTFGKFSALIGRFFLWQHSYYYVFNSIFRYSLYIMYSVLAIIHIKRSDWLVAITIIFNFNWCFYMECTLDNCLLVKLLGHWNKQKALQGNRMRRWCRLFQALWHSVQSGRWPAQPPQRFYPPPYVMHWAVRRRTFC